MSVLSNSPSALSQEMQSDEAITGSKMSPAHTESPSESHSSNPGTETPVLSESPEAAEENQMKNPFTIPPDMDIFSIRDKERKKAKEERERMKTMKVHEKITYSSKIKAKHKGLRKALQKEEEEEARKQATDKERLKTLLGSPSCKKAGKNDYAIEKETFRDYVNDRREIFLLEYAMQVKKDEIKRIENILKNEESKLEKSEYHLEKEAATFDGFLKENQKNSVQALKTARKETTGTKKKTSEVQAITSQIENVQSDISRFKYTLDEYKMYRDLLYHLSPKEWQAEHGKKHTKEKRAEQGQGPTVLDSSNSTSCMDVPSSLLPSGLEFSSLHEIGTQLKNFLKPLLTRKSSLLEDEESESCSDEDEEPELYFTEPQQLLSAFTEMEKENLSFIQNSQEAEESFDKVQHTFITTCESTEKELAELKQQVDTLKSSIAKEEKRLENLKVKVHFFSLGEDKADDQDKLLTSLNKKVLEVYHHCTGENEANLQTVEMLMVIEKQFNDLLDMLERTHPAKIERAEKVRKKERRIWLREEKLRQQKQHQEERAQRALERSQRALEISPATRIKQSDRRVVFHTSPPARKGKKKPRQEEIDKEKEEELFYFT
ncbi:cilia- and flagella-associated protein 100 [Heliangelus exortis]|uniref:cilia- and flagella-associated protein 100 n=1 Tax=Heliangelus exortis TaxID=472823 RepID=UPI003A927A90